MTIRQLLADLSTAFSTFEDPKAEARHLVMSAMKLNLNGLLMRGDDQVSAIDLAKIEIWKLERLKGVPLAYLEGHKAFYKYEFIVRPGVLVPRPETEFVVETALRRSPDTVRHIADFGCGSGCIGLSLLKEWPEALLTAIDKSPAAVEVTGENALRLHLTERVQIVHESIGHWDMTPAGPFDVIVANPPYIAEGDPQVQKSVHDFEPHEALYAGDNGYAAIREWLRVSWTHLRAGGLCIMEIGSGQSARVQDIMSELGYGEIQATKDLGQIERVISAIKME